MLKTYEMTNKEYFKNFYNSLSEFRKEIFKEQEEKPEGWTWTMRTTETAKHKVAIIDAIWTGINVSEKVLKDYPDIKEQFKKEIEENLIGMNN